MIPKFKHIVIEWFEKFKVANVIDRTQLAKFISSCTGNYCDIGDSSLKEIMIKYGK